MKLMCWLQSSYHWIRVLVIGESTSSFNWPSEEGDKEKGHSWTWHSQSGTGSLLWREFGEFVISLTKNNYTYNPHSHFPSCKRYLLWVSLVERLKPVNSIYGLGHWCSWLSLSFYFLLKTAHYFQRSFKPHWTGNANQPGWRFWLCSWEEIAMNCFHTMWSNILKSIHGARDQISQKRGHMKGFVFLCFSQDLGIRFSWGKLEETREK